jgi:hypothetical protein
MNGPTRQTILANSALVPIYGLAFGRDADYELVRRISESSGGFARRIYEGSDAALQATILRVSISAEKFPEQIFTTKFWAKFCKKIYI